MKKVTLLTVCFLYIITLKAQERYQPTWESLKTYQAPDWFRDAKFGIFIHWGVYSVPAFDSEWYPRLMYEKGHKVYEHHVKTYGPHTKFGYKDFIPMFRAEKFNADEWMDLFVRSGAKYVVPVAEHHDGFAMYKTALSKWNAAEMGPNRDIIGELAAAAKKHDVIFGVSSHRIEHWFFMNEGRKYDSDVNDEKFEDFYGPAKVMNPWDNNDPNVMSTEFMNDWLLRTVELVDKYQPQLIWFDWWIEQPNLEPYRKNFAAYYYNKGLEWNKGVVINYKNDAYPKEAAVYDIERGSSKATKKDPWQTDTSVGKRSWGYIDGEENKSPNEIIDVLVDIVSKNGNLLLNIGPKADGTITREQQEVLVSIGEWLRVNGEGIYGTRPWVIDGEGPTQNPDENIKFNETKYTGYNAKDIRFTSKGDHVYMFLLDPPMEKVRVASLGGRSGRGKIKSISLVGSTEPVKWSQTPHELVIQPAKSYPTSHAVAYQVAFETDHQ